MIRTTYRGRAIKVLAARGKPNHRKMVINGWTVNHAWQGDDTQGLNWFKLVIDRMDEAGGPAAATGHLLYERNWWEPGTFDVNPNGHVTAPGGICICSWCVIDDPCGSKGRYAPLPVDACQHCHQLEDGHDDDVFLDWHRYTPPTETQRAGRQATVNEYTAMTAMDDDPSEATCDEIYPEAVRGYLGRPRCLYFADHRDAHDPNFHQDPRGFRWPMKAVQAARSV
ncbi:hypothetical protein [Streptomyces pseudovenezuelae]|uniref:hypothetical protein n=1 Tax=Streptomyces pseudovenezuelae TaxID=67350 RepID=UPI002E80FF78|nr:hypothetical protein [Streptomyces pseudovenezuelae]WUA94478.1 hypothetical protein OHO81_44700 [Streptomyces pseudovenezuelae]